MRYWIVSVSIDIDIEFISNDIEFIELISRLRLPRQCQTFVQYGAFTLRFFIARLMTVTENQYRSLMTVTENQYRSLMTVTKKPI